ncbi:hypothetical protein BOTBODRAFT_60870 [Botryobasidium botryosum FD-172 SS1]|uniref:Uncharacterized protein n=1 Tax=Botryobasidium botryosum (strain FD-172 SS1) TaxID=930990 RepID=A0A067M1R6_BOTB1|nr:hypothetical protein BOTBODRAFT_60870 [Botryobasidium botryosum FD-172 SS1]
MACEEHERQRREADPYLIARFRQAYAKEVEMKHCRKTVLHPPVWCPSTRWGCFPGNIVLPPPICIPPISAVQPSINVIQVPYSCASFNSAPTLTTSTNPFYKFLSLPPPALLNITGPAVQRFPSSPIAAIAPSSPSSAQPRPSALAAPPAGSKHPVAISSVLTKAAELERQERNKILRSTIFEQLSTTCVSDNPTHVLQNDVSTCFFILLIIRLFIFHESLDVSALYTTYRSSLHSPFHPLVAFSHIFLFPRQGVQ